MARIDYFAIEQEIATILEADTELAGVRIDIETEVSTYEGPTVIIFLDDRVAPDDLQSLSAGQKTRMYVTFTLICAAPNYETLRAAAQARDDLIGRVEVALMNNRTLNNRVRTSWLDGGLFDNAKDEQGGFVSAGEVRLIVDVTSSTV